VNPLMAMTPAPLTPPTPTPTPMLAPTAATTPPQVPVLVPAPSRWVEHVLLWAAQRPWLALVPAVGLVAWIAGRNLLSQRRHRHHADDARLVTIAPPPQVEPASAATLWANLAGILTPSRRRRILQGVPHVVFESTWTSQQLLISIWIPGSIPHCAVEAAVRAAWPGAAASTQPATDPIPAAVDAQSGGHLLPIAAEWLPLRTDHHADPLRAPLRYGIDGCVEPVAVRGQIARASSAIAAATRVASGASTASS